MGQGGGRPHPNLAGPHDIGASTEEGLQEVVTLAKELDTGINIHFCNICDEACFIRREYGCSPSEFLQRIDMMGKKILLSHHHLD